MMGLTKRQICWCVLILAALTYPSEEGTIRRTKRFDLSKIEQMYQDVIKLPMRIKTFVHRSFGNNSNAEMEVEPSITTTTTSTVTPIVETRYFIEAPLRCKPHEIVINGKCRLNIDA